MRATMIETKCLHTGNDATRVNPRVVASVDAGTGAPQVPLHNITVDFRDAGER